MAVDRLKRYEALITRADALGDEADRLGTGSVNVSNTAARVIADDVTRLVADYAGAVDALRAIRERTDKEYDDEMIEDVVTIVDGVLYPNAGPRPLGGQS